MPHGRRQFGPCRSITENIACGAAYNRGMIRLKRVLPAVLLLLCLLAAGYFWHQYRQRNPVVRDVPRQGGLDVTLLAISDLHFGSPVLGRGANGKQTWVPAMPVARLQLQLPTWVVVYCL